MKVREIMTSGSLATATLDTTVEEIANMMKAEDVGAIPVLDDDEKLAGIITDRDIVVRAIAEGEDPTECTAEDILSEQLHTIEADADVDEALELMSRHQIRRLPVVEAEQVVGILSLGDVSVKSGEAEAGEALEDISDGVRQPQGRERQQPGRDARNRQSAHEGDVHERNQENGGRNTQSNGGRNRRAQDQSAGEQVAGEEAEHQRGHQDTSLRRTPQRAGNEMGGTRAGAQSGGTRSESGLSGRVRNASQSRQSVTDDLVNTEGEEEPEFQNAGGGQSRQRANQQNTRARGGQESSSRGKQGSSSRGQELSRGRQEGSSRGRQEASTRGRQESSARGRDSGPVRGEDAGRSSRGNTQGITNRSARQENQRQQKVAPMRAEAKNPRGQGKRRAS